MLVAGFIVTGIASKQVVIRALGPDLAAAGLSGVLADPTLELHEADGTVISNDNWKDTQQAALSATGSQPNFDADSAILATLAPGGHTAIVSGKNAGTGVGLVEVYDIESPGVSSLANISTRGDVQSADNVMIGGVIVGGAEPAPVLVRAIGPSLTGFRCNGRWPIRCWNCTTATAA